MSFKLALDAAVLAQLPAGGAIMTLVHSYSLANEINFNMKKSECRDRVDDSMFSRIWAISDRMAQL